MNRIKLTNEELNKYWKDIPIGIENKISYPRLMVIWGVNKRKVRMILHELSLFDNNDDYILIRSNKGGFWKSSNKKEIVEYKKECYNKALSMLASITKINRVLKYPNDGYNLFDLNKGIENAKD